MKKILLISIAFPPKSDPESIQVGRYCKALLKEKWEIDVITSALPTLYMEEDPDLSCYANGINRLHQVTLFENRYINFLLRKINPTCLQYPDSKYSFQFLGPKVAKPDLIYSRSYPLSSTLLALKYKIKWPDIPWVLHLSDPWVTQYEGETPATQFRNNSKRWNQKKEALCFRWADKISFTSDKTIDLYRSYYPEYAHKFILSPNVFDEERVFKGPVDFKEKIRVIYTGGFGEKRNPDIFLEPLIQFKLNHSVIFNQFEFIFSGPMTQENKSKFEKYKQIPNLKHLGMIPYNEMLELQKTAHVLLNIDTDIKDPKQSVFFPSKLLEYFAANRRVLTISNEHALTWDVVQENGGDCISFSETEKLSTFLELYYNEFLNQNHDFFQPLAAQTKYSAGRNAASLSSIFLSLISPNKD